MGASGRAYGSGFRGSFCEKRPGRSSIFSGSGAVALRSQPHERQRTTPSTGFEEGLCGSVQYGLGQFQGRSRAAMVVREPRVLYAPRAVPEPGSNRCHLFGHPVSAVTAPTVLIALPFADHVRPSGFQPFRARTLRPRRHPTSSAIRRTRHAGLLPSLRQPGVSRPPRRRPGRLVGLRQRLQHEIQHGGIEATNAPHALSDWPPAGWKAAATE